MSTPPLYYLDEKHIKQLGTAVRSFFTAISQDPKFKTPFWQGNTQWEFFEEYFVKHARDTTLQCAKWIVENHSDAKKAISEGEIFDFFHKGVFYHLTFNKVGILLLNNEKKEGNSFTLEFIPREVNLESALKDQRELATVLNLADQHIAESVNFYKNHKSIARLNISNLKIDPGLAWEFSHVHFISKEENTYKDTFLRWVSGNKLIAKEYEEGDDEFGNLAVVKFEGCSAYKALLISLNYFNKVFAILRLLAQLRLPRQHWTSRDYLEIPDKTIAIESSEDNPMWSAITPSVDNDFFVAFQENSIYLPLILTKENVEVIEKYENLSAFKNLLSRTFQEKAHPIDNKIFDALSWYSESLKNFIIVHKIIGFITALETILTDKHLTDGLYDKGISEMFSERGAIILHEDYETRLQTKKKLKDIYGLRSKIVHGQTRQLFKSSDDEMKTLNEIQQITAEIIARIIVLIDTEGIKSIAELNDLVLKKLLS